MHRRQDIRIDISSFHTPLAGPSPTCLPCRKTRGKDKDVSGADRLLETESPSPFASRDAFRFDRDRMIVTGSSLVCGRRDAMGTIRISVREVVGSYSMATDNSCFNLTFI